MDKRVFTIFKAIKKSKPYILQNHTKVVVPHPAVRSLFVQKELGEQRGNWMTAIQEYDLELKPVTIVRGQGLCKLAAEAPDPIDSGEEGWEKEISMYAQ